MLWREDLLMCMDDPCAFGPWSLWKVEGVLGIGGILCFVEARPDAPGLSGEQSRCSGLNGRLLGLAYYFNKYDHHEPKGPSYPFISRFLGVRYYSSTIRRFAAPCRNHVSSYSSASTRPTHMPC